MYGCKVILSTSGVRVVENPVQQRRAWWSLAALCLSLFGPLIASTGLNTMLHQIALDLSMSSQEIQWTVNVYWLLTCALVVLGGQLGDRFGRRKMFFVGIVVFFLASVIAALAYSVWMMVLSRALQGLGTLFIMPATVSIIDVVFSDKSKPTAYMIWGSTIGLGTAVGPFVSGVITDSLSWRATFWFILPFGVVAFLLALFVMPESKNEKASFKFDWLGVVLFGAGIFLIVLTIDLGSSWGLSSLKSLGAGFTGLLLIAAFVLLEFKIKDPLIHLKHLQKKQVLAGNLSTFVLMFVFIGAQFELNLFVQNHFSYGYSAFQAGLTMMWISLPYFIFSLSVSKLVNFMGNRNTMCLGGTFMGVGSLVLYCLDPSGSYILLAVGLFCIGIGLGLSTAPATTIAMGGIPKEQAGEASGMNSVFRYFGGVLGVGLIGAIYHSNSKAVLQDILSEHKMGFSDGLFQSAMLGSEKALGQLKNEPYLLQETAFRDINEALHSAVSSSMLVLGLSALGIAALTYWLLREKPTVVSSS